MIAFLFSIFDQAFQFFDEFFGINFLNTINRCGECEVCVVVSHNIRISVGLSKDGLEFRLVGVGKTKGPPDVISSGELSATILFGNLRIHDPAKSSLTVTSTGLDHRTDGPLELIGLGLLGRLLLQDLALALGVENLVEPFLEFRIRQGIDLPPVGLEPVGILVGVVGGGGEHVVLEGLGGVDAVLGPVVQVFYQRAGPTGLRFLRNPRKGLGVLGLDVGEEGGVILGCGDVLHCGNILHQNAETVNPLGRFFLLFFRFP